MHQIVLLTALTATSGLFGGGRCAGGRCATAYTPTYSACQPGTPCAVGGYYAPPAYGAYQAPVAAPAPVAATAPVAAPAQVAAPAPARTVMAPAQAAYYPSYYYPAAAGCAGGNCYRR